jgi:asparagine synthase (glutamine-hydrolysing)
MCGVAGILSAENSDNKYNAIKMAEALYHRGPDSNGIWDDAAAGIAMSHTRLSIIDLSHQGSQPMISRSGRYILSYNGEIYNYIEIKSSLKNAGIDYWRGHSDTEVLLSAIEQWGVKKTLTKLNGMFAFGLWDRETRQLILARDRIGEKPLYIGWIRDKIVFSSELKGLYCIPDWHGDINTEALNYFLRFGFIPSPLSIYKNVHKLPPAHYCIFNTESTKNPLTIEMFKKAISCYWDLDSVAINAIPNRRNADSNNYLERLEELLSDSIKLRMTSDVPLGALLSGGIDSSIVTAISQRHSSKPVKTFTIGFIEKKFDEARFARSVADYIGSNHTEVILSPNDSLAVIPKLAEMYDEPFADPSQIPAFLISSIARQQVTVALSGDGGDELFCGYSRYRAGQQIWSIVQHIPPHLRIKAGKLCADFFIQIGKNIKYQKLKLLAFRLWRLTKRITEESFESFYANLIALSLHPVSNTGWPSKLPVTGCGQYSKRYMDNEQLMMYLDQKSYLPDNILVKTDRASMAVSLEIRIPFLDHRIIEFAWGLPARLRRKGKTGKLLLQQLLSKYVPRPLFDRPKRGFDIPLDDWLRGPLREWMTDLLSTELLIKNGFMNHTRVYSLMRDHLEGNGNHGYALWPILIFHSWFNNIK